MRFGYVLISVLMLYFPASAGAQTNYAQTRETERILRSILPAAAKCQWQQFDRNLRKAQCSLDGNPRLDIRLTLGAESANESSNPLIEVRVDVMQSSGAEDATVDYLGRAIRLIVKFDWWGFDEAAINECLRQAIAQGNHGVDPTSIATLHRYQLRSELQCGFSISQADRLLSYRLSAGSNRGDVPRAF